MATGGSIESVTLEGRIFSVAADADGQRKLGGFENAVESNGDGSARLIKTRVPAMLSGITLSIDDTRGDHEYLQDLANRNDFFAAAMTLASGAVWQGRLQITDEINYSTTNTVATVSLAGPGTLTVQ